MEKRVTNLECTVAELRETCERTDKSVQSIVERLDKLLREQQQSGASNDHNAGRRQVITEEDVTVQHEALGLGSYSDLQAEYKAVRDSVAKVKLPQHLVVGDSRAGIGRGDLAKFNTIQRCARYQETLLKIISTSEESSATATLANLTPVILAQLRYLQEEYTNLIVSSQFDEGTAKLFQTLQQNPASFPENALENLQRAVTIAGARPPRQVGFSGHPSRGRGPTPLGHSRGAGRWHQVDYSRRPWAVSHSADWRRPPGGPESRDTPFSRWGRSDGGGAAGSDQ